MPPAPPGGKSGLTRAPCRGRSATLFTVGEWLSLVEHLVRDQGVAGSNPVSPTNLKPRFARDFRNVSRLLFSPLSRFGTRLDHAATRSAAVIADSRCLLAVISRER